MIMLHAHLPYIRYPEHENFLEENWLYETMTETYIPLINTLGDLVGDEVDFRIPDIRKMCVQAYHEIASGRI